MREADCHLDEDSTEHWSIGEPLLEMPVVAGYEILGELGRGSMGVVYKARQQGHDRVVALKTLLAGAVHRQEGLDRFISEARVLARLQHPNIVQVYEVSIQRDLPFFAMELVEGGNLATWLAGRPQGFRQAAELIAQLARAIQAAHELGIVHRDLKPANVLLCSPVSPRPDEDRVPEGRDYIPKITDFGLAKQLEGESALTQSGMIVGTPAYMAPEQASGRSRDVGPAADIYALGAILYECLTGRPPYNAESPAECVLLLFQVDPVNPSRLRAKLPRDLETICLKCLHKNPASRYASALALAEDLDRFLAGLPIHARPAPLSEHVWKWFRRRPILSTALASLAVTVVLGVGALCWHQGYLHSKLVEARQEEQEARDATEAARERERLIRLHLTVSKHLEAAETALAGDRWEKAVAPLHTAWSLLRDETQLNDLRQRCLELTARATQQSSDRKQLFEFRRLHERALVEATVFAGGDLPPAREQTRQAARAALAVYDLVLDARPKPTLDSPYLHPDEKREVLIGCYELFLLLAEVTAQGGKDPADARQRAREALEWLDRAEVLGLKTQAWHRRRARYLAQAGDAREAAEEEKRVAAMKPTGLVDYFLLGEAAYHHGDHAAAALAFERVLQEQPQHFWGQCFLALSQWKQQRGDMAVATLTACTAQRPEFPWLYLIRGMVRVGLGRYQEAEADFSKAQALGLEESGKYVLLNHRGILRIEQKRYPDAVRDLTAAIELRPRHHQGLANLAVAHLRAGDLDAALAAFDRAIALDGQVASLYRSRARVQLVRKKDDLALADLRQAIRLDAAAPPGVRAADHLECARVLLRRKDYAAALTACEAAGKLSATPQGHRLKAEIHLALARPADALAALTVCLKETPNDIEALCARALVRTKLGQYQGAQADYTRALDVAPNAEILAARGWTFLLTDTAKLAVTDFDKALALDKTLSDALVGRALAKAQLGQIGQAVEDAKLAVAQGPPSARLAYNAARVHAQAALRGDRRAADEHVRQGVELLTAALGQLPAAHREDFWQASVLTDPLLRSLRGTPSFLRLAKLYSFPTEPR